MQDTSLVELLEDEKKNVRVENLAISIGEIISMYQSGELILRPEYQRLLKWDDKQKTLLIESLLLGLPTPSVFVSVDENGKWEIVDGLQRLSTIIDFIAGLSEENTKHMQPEYKRFDKLSDDLVYLAYNNKATFEGKKFNDFPFKIQLELKRQRINVVILLSGTNEDVKYELFQRVNQGGTPITPMELRRAILSYQNKDILNKIEEVASSALFRSFFPDNLVAKDPLQADASVEYFLTLYRKADEIRKKTEKVISVDGFITKYIRSLKREEILEDLETFKQVLEKIKSLKLDNPSKVFIGSQRYSDTVFGAITLGIAFNIKNLPSNTILKTKIENTFAELAKKDIARRGFSAPARIPKMIDFAHKHFAKN